jgi:hypothetical protein
VESRAWKYGRRGDGETIDEARYAGVVSELLGQVAEDDDGSHCVGRSSRLVVNG